MNRIIKIMILPLLIFGCAHQLSPVDRLTDAERKVLQTYYDSPETVEQAARICLNRALTKDEVLYYTSDLMRREVEENSITFYYAPSQIWSITFGQNDEAISSNVTGKDITRAEVE